MDSRLYEMTICRVDLTTTDRKVPNPMLPPLEYASDVRGQQGKALNGGVSEHMCINAHTPRTHKIAV